MKGGQNKIGGYSTRRIDDSKKWSVPSTFLNLRYLHSARRRQIIGGQPGCKIDGTIETWFNRKSLVDLSFLLSARLLEAVPSIKLSNDSMRADSDQMLQRSPNDIPGE